MRISKPALPFRSLILFALFVVLSLSAKADRIYIMNADGYNTMNASIENSITDLGHTVDVQTTGLTSLPTGFTTTCIDPLNGYDWLAFFGNFNFESLIPEIQQFIDDGGKVFYQYEVSCCTIASQSAADVASGLTGLSITPNSNSYIALGTVPAWEAADISCCMTFQGNAYKGLDGLPEENQMQATANLNGSSPSIANSLNFGFYFATDDFISGANQGGIVGVGDVNLWFDGEEPSGTINPLVAEYFFPNEDSDCYLFPPGCMESFFGGTGSIVGFDLGPDTTLCEGSTLNLDMSSFNSYEWQDGSTDPVFVVTEAGEYWVEVSNLCGSGSDTLNVDYVPAPELDLGMDTVFCENTLFTIDATIDNATSYQWQNNDNNSSITVGFPGEYWVEVTVANCVVTDTINVGYSNLPQDLLGIDLIMCEGDEVLLTADATEVTYEWQDGSTNQSLNASGGGLYWVEISDGFCFQSDSMTISIDPPPGPVLSGPIQLCEGDTLVLNASTENAFYEWLDGSDGPLFEVTEAGEYWVEISKLCGTYVDEVEVFTVDCNFSIAMPNIFSPNDDEVNDKLVPIVLTGVREVSLTIFNRWGSEIYHSDELTEILDGWDASGVADGTYYWVMSYTKEVGGDGELSGYVMVAR